MRIHSSSLTLTPASFSRQQAGKQINGQNKDEKNEVLINSEDHGNNQPIYPTYSAKEISYKTENGALPVHLTDNANTNSPINTRASRALNAYSLELNKLPPDHSTRTIQRIDTYA
jgi:hypothetical protein